MVDAVKSLAVRGAPAIGMAGAAAVALWARESRRGATGAGEVSAYLADSAEADEVACARPTAVNLRWARGAVLGRARVRATGARLLRPSPTTSSTEASAWRPRTRPRTAPSAPTAPSCCGRAPASSRTATPAAWRTAFYGTALGIVYAAAAQGKMERVYADETRPVGQGARLTSWELSRANVPCTLVCDNMAASLMAAGRVDAVLVGADRIAANGDAANKIGTYGVAVLARHHGIPFYVAAPTSTIDPTLPDGSGIPIEERDPAEVLPQPLPGVEVWNPAFDVTPAALITRIVTERGVFEPGKLVY